MEKLKPNAGGDVDFRDVHCMCYEVGVQNIVAGAHASATLGSTFIRDKTFPKTVCTVTNLA